MASRDSQRNQGSSTQERRATQRQGNHIDGRTIEQVKDPCVDCVNVCSSWACYWSCFPCLNVALRGATIRDCQSCERNLHLHSVSGEEKFVFFGPVFSVLSQSVELNLFWDAGGAGKTRAWRRFLQMVNL